MKISYILVILTAFLISCEDRNYVPKPPTYLKINLPERSYDNYNDDCNFSFNKPNYFKVKSVQQNSCNKDILLEGLDGTLHLSVIDIDTTLGMYINHANDKVGEHKIKATAIIDTTIIRSEDRVFGTFFELQGNVASPFQFYVTDSTDRFFSGVVYFNSRPNYDSIKPTLNFVRKDLIELMNTINWENK
jgi:gliding motility-associated lipoprotein GldD